MPLTDTAIRALKPKATRYSGTDERGLVLEVFPTGGMLWHYRYRLNGKQERVTLGRYPALSLKPALSSASRPATSGMRPPRAEACNLHGACPEPRAITQGVQPEEPPSRRKRPRRPYRVPRRLAMQPTARSGSGVPRPSQFPARLGDRDGQKH